MNFLERARSGEILLGAERGACFVRWENGEQDNNGLVQGFLQVLFIFNDWA